MTSSSRLLIFPALGAAIISGIVLARAWWLLIPGGWLLWRVWTLAQPRVFFSLVLSISLMGAYCGIVDHRADQLTITAPRQVDQQVLVMPDSVDVNGGLAVCRARDLKTGQAETLMINLRTQAEQQRLTRMTHCPCWTVAGELRPNIPATNFNQFDSRCYYRAQRIYNQLSVDEWHVAHLAPPSTMITFCHQIRAQLLAYFATMPEPLAGYCQQLIVGANDRQNQSMMDDVKRLGVIHLFCISGMHVVLLTGMCRRGLIYLRLTKEEISLLLAVMLPAYLIIGGGAASLTRAVVMAEAGLLAGHRSLSRLDCWSASLIVGILIDPYVLLSLGGQLSYLLSFMLQVLPRTLTGLKQAMVMNLSGLPCLIHSVYEFHLLSFVSSFVMIPVFGVLIFPAILLVATTYWLLPTPGLVVNETLQGIHRLLGWLADCPGMIHFGQPPAPVCGLMFLLVLWTAGNLHQRQAWQGLGLVVLVTFLMVHYPLTGEVTFVDIGQGDSIIVRTPFSRHVVLIDTGGRLNFVQHQWQRRIITSDTAQRTSLNYLKSRGISKIDAVCLSHHDTDHIGYLPTVLREMKVTTVLVPAGMERQPRFRRLLMTPDGHFQPIVVPVKAGASLAGTGLTVFHPFKSGKAENTDSMVLAGTFGGQSFLFTGDLDQAGERRLMKRYPTLHVDVLKLGHHGSKTASGLAFLRQVQPRYGIISAGRFNRYGHPNNATMARLKKAQVRPISTQQYGMIRYNYWGSHGNWQTKLQGDELKWMLPPYDNS